MRKRPFRQNKVVRYLILMIVMALPVRAEPLRILAMGDSVMAWNAWSGKDIPSVMGAALGAEITSVAVSGANFATRSGKGDIRSQYVAGDWDLVVVNGGANDFANGCGCGACFPYLDLLIDADLQGLIPAFLGQLETDILWVGYYATGFTGPFSGCRDALVEMETRLSRLAEKMPNLRFVDAEDVIEPRNRAHFFYDRVHPSRLGSRLIGTYLAQQIVR